MNQGDEEYQARFEEFVEFLSGVTELHVFCNTHTKKPDPDCDRCNGSLLKNTKRAVKKVAEETQAKVTKDHNSLRLLKSARAQVNYQADPKLAFRWINAVARGKPSRANRIDYEHPNNIRNMRESALEFAQIDFPEITDETFDEMRDTVLAKLDERIANVEARIDKSTKLITSGKALQVAIRKAEEIVRESNAEAPKPTIKPEPKPTKAGGKLCSAPHCTKPSTVWDERSKGWCKRHAPRKLRFGIVMQPKED